MSGNESIVRINIPWETYFALLRQLIRNIRAADFKPEQIVCIARGGLIPGDILSRVLNAPLAIISVASYPDGQTSQEQIVFSRDLTSARPLQRESILLVDDLTESGETLEKTWRWLCTWYGLDPKEVKTATVWHKAWSNFKPDFYAEFVDLDPKTGTRPWIEQPQELFRKSLEP